MLDDINGVIFLAGMPHFLNRLCFSEEVARYDVIFCTLDHMYNVKKVSMDMEYSFLKGNQNQISLTREFIGSCIWNDQVL